MEDRAAGAVNRTSPLLDWLSLFGSLGTLLCCALPSVLVLLGLGATVASLLSAAPWLVTLSRHKVSVFTLSGLLIGVNVAYVYVLTPRLRLHAASCDSAAGQACDSAGMASRALLWISIVAYAGGFFTAFLLPQMLLLW